MLHRWHVAAIGLATTGCLWRPVGPKTIAPARYDYNEAISRSWDEQLILNLVRLRYRDNPLFVDVNSITASYSIAASGSLGASLKNTLSLNDVSGGVGVAVSENPVISYGYLRGEEFAQRLLSPLAATDLRILAQSGWSASRLLLCCYQAVNGLENATSATGPTPEAAPEFEPFQRMAGLVRQLQLTHRLTWDYEADGKTYLRFLPAAGPVGDELRALLTLDPGADRFELVPVQGPRQATQIAAQGRSLLGVMFFLSQSVEVPEAHRAAGKVTITRDASGAEFDWSRLVGPLMRIRSGGEAPADAAIRVRYRDHWFWIDDNDLNSKTTFSLLRLLLFLKSTGSQGFAPLVTIPTR